LVLIVQAAQDPEQAKAALVVPPESVYLVSVTMVQVLMVQPASSVEQLGREEAELALVALGVPQLVPLCLLVALVQRTFQQLARLQPFLIVHSFAAHPCDDWLKIVQASKISNLRQCDARTFFFANRILAALSILCVKSLVV